MSILWLIVSIVLAAPPAAAEEGMTFGDLQGRTVEVKVISDRTIFKNGRRFPSRAETSLHVEFGPGDTVSHKHTAKVTGPRGTRQTPALMGKFVLSKSRPVGSRGGGRAMYTFSEQTLTFVRTFRKGAFKYSVSFARTGAGGLTCVVRGSFAREGGRGSIELVNPFDGRPIKIVSYKQVSSDCRVKARD